MASIAIAVFVCFAQFAPSLGTHSLLGTSCTYSLRLELDQKKWESMYYEAEDQADEQWHTEAGHHIPKSYRSVIMAEVSHHRRWMICAAVALCILTLAILAKHCSARLLKKAIESLGETLGAPIVVDSVSVNVFTGKVHINGLIVKNPPGGYLSDFMIKTRQITVIVEKNASLKTSNVREVLDHLLSLERSERDPMTKKKLKIDIEEVKISEIGVGFVADKSSYGGESPHHDLVLANIGYTDFDEQVGLQETTAIVLKNVLKTIIKHSPVRAIGDSWF